MPESHLTVSHDSSPWMAAMLCGDFEAAWRETDRVELERRRLERVGRLARQPYHLLWNGEEFAGRDVLVRCHHGLGDTLQFVRFVPGLRTVARSVAVLAQPPLVELLRAQPGLGEIRNGWTDFHQAPHELEIEVMELAYAMRATPETAGSRVPYLASPTGQPPALPPRSELQVGLLWAASDWEVRRSIPLSALAPLGSVPGVVFHSLQQGAQADEWHQSSLGLLPLARQTQEIAHAASAMAQLDLIITVDGMAAHLAGALGRPVWVLLQHQADWRWRQAGGDSSWYPSMRLFRQPEPGAWSPVVAEAAAALRAKRLLWQEKDLRPAV